MACRLVTLLKRWSSAGFWEAAVKATHGPDAKSVTSTGGLVLSGVARNALRLHGIRDRAS